MMMALRGRRGSALLIVLGMLSFMVVSAVGFSVYMRTSRAPSSYLRRNLAARYLVRAALAKAIEELEGDVNTDENWGGSDYKIPYHNEHDSYGNPFYGIYDDPFPGVVLNDVTARNNPRENGDFWAGRVFAPFDCCDVDETVSTLTLEALAYLPPAIINDVRYFSRRTRTACWRSLPYDTGRYAYCAVNVSDLFDINRLRANKARNSGANRITLSSLCTSDFGGQPTYAAALDAVLKNNNGVPFTSLADFNYAAGASGSSFAPFMSSAVGGNGTFAAVNSLFITDTWFPPTNANASISASFSMVDAAMPFKDYNARSFMETLTKLNDDVKSSDGGTTLSEVLQKNLDMGVACLYDYLDSDSKPISLALPTIEAVPMVVGISAPATLKPSVAENPEDPFKIEEKLSGRVRDSAGTETDSAEIEVVRTMKKVTLSSFFNNAPIVTFVVTCPFKRLDVEKRLDDKNHKARAMLRLWLAPDGAKCRQKIDYFYPGSDLWGNEGSVSVQNVADGGSIVTYVSDRVSISDFKNKKIKETGDAIVEKSFRFSSDNLNIPLYYDVEEQVVPPPGYVAAEPDPGQTEQSYRVYGDIWNDGKQLKPWGMSNGSIVQDKAWEEKAKSSGQNFNKMKKFNSGAKYDTSSLNGYRIYAALWVQILDGEDVVDMVPACAKDDVVWLGANLPNPDSLAYDRWCGSGAPLLNFRSDRDIALSSIKDDLEQTSEFAGWKSLYAVDPRYNFAPEDWFSNAGDAATKSKWEELLDSSSIFGQGGRDRDIFMFVSDQEYLQSIGELQFLPRLDVMDGTANFNSGDYSPNFHGKAFSETGRDKPNLAFANVWMTYTAYNNGDGTTDINPYEMKSGSKMVCFQSDGFKLNPFSQDDRVFTAAFFDTPFDYYVASTNKYQEVPNMVLNSIKTLDDAKDYSFCDDCDVAKIDGERVLQFADAIRDRIENHVNSGSVDWLAAWNSLNWAGTGVKDSNREFLGVTLGDEPECRLHDVDRKFLYSFWRDCFDNRQQLFLIFVRAEPASVGGGSTSQISSQLGGRAVALVWRDPAVPEKNAADRPNRTDFTSVKNLLDKRGDNKFPPHRTRLLFYHQFD